MLQNILIVKDCLSENAPGSFNDKFHPSKLPHNKKKKKLYGPFLWMGFNCLKARATSRRQFTFYH